jgi:hypothetical protein
MYTKGQLVNAGSYQGIIKQVRPTGCFVTYTDEIVCQDFRTCQLSKEIIVRTRFFKNEEISAIINKAKGE